MRNKRADTDGEHDQGTSGTESSEEAGEKRSIAGHAAAHPHDGHDGDQSNPHSQPKHGGTHHDMAARHEAEHAKNH